MSNQKSEEDETVVDVNGNTVRVTEFFDKEGRVKYDVALYSVEDDYDIPLTTESGYLDAFPSLTRINELLTEENIVAGRAQVLGTEA